MHDLKNGVGFRRTGSGRRGFRVEGTLSPKQEAENRVCRRLKGTVADPRACLQAQIALSRSPTCSCRRLDFSGLN
jgi:hypothetical protein